MVLASLRLLISRVRKRKEKTQRRRRNEKTRNKHCTQNLQLKIFVSLLFEHVCVNKFSKIDSKYILGSPSSASKNDSNSSDKNVILSRTNSPLYFTFTKTTTKKQQQLKTSSTKKHQDKQRGEISRKTKLSKCVAIREEKEHHRNLKTFDGKNSSTIIAKRQAKKKSNIRKKIKKENRSEKIKDQKRSKNRSNSKMHHSLKMLLKKKN